MRTAFADATVEELKPLNGHDPRGATLNLMMLPLIVAALLVSFLLSRLPVGGPGLAGATLGFSVLGGFVVTGLVAGLIGALPGPLPRARGRRLAAHRRRRDARHRARTADRPAGRRPRRADRLPRRHPASGAVSAPEMLPDFWRQIGPPLPPGAGANALRDVAYFDGAALAGPLVVLAVFAAAAAVLMLASPRRAER